MGPGMKMVYYMFCCFLCPGLFNKFYDMYGHREDTALVRTASGILAQDFNVDRQTARAMLDQGIVACPEVLQVSNTTGLEGSQLEAAQPEGGHLAQPHGNDEGDDELARALALSLEGS